MELFDGRYEFLEQLGRGATANVWKVRDVNTNVVEALKIFNDKATGSEDIAVKLFTHEFALLANAAHPNLVRPLHFAVSNDGYPYLRLKYCDGGSIKNKIRNISEEEMWRFFRDIASALDYLNNMETPVIHQDIKPGNILIHKGRFMLSDFGISVKTAMTQMSKALSTSGSLPYMAPEKYKKNRTPVMANDIWSLGATAYEVITGETPFGPDGGLAMNRGEKLPPINGNYSQLLKETIAQCLDKETWKRPTAKQLYETACQALGESVTPLADKTTINLSQGQPFGGSLGGSMGRSVNPNSIRGSQGGWQNERSVGGSQQGAATGVSNGGNDKKSTLFIVTIVAVVAAVVAVAALLFFIFTMDK